MRRKPDTIEVQQMKAQNKEEKLAKQQKRENAEKMQAEYEERFRSMQQEMERRQGELSTAQEAGGAIEGNSGGQGGVGATATGVALDDDQVGRQQEPGS